MNFDLEKNQDTNREVYEMLNMGIVLKRESLQTKEWHARHQVSLVGMGSQRKYAQGVHRNVLVQNAIYSERDQVISVPKKRGYPCFKHPLLFKNMGTRKIQGMNCYQADLGNSSSLESMNSQWSDYNRRTNVPFVYQSTLPKYHELVRN